MVWDKRMADKIPLRQDEGIAGFKTDGEGWALPIQGAGMPVIWNDSPTVAVTGRILYTLDDSAIRKLLSGGLLLDGSAAETLNQMGYEEFVGVSTVEKFSRYETLLSAEEFFAADFGGKPQLYIDTRRFSEGNQFYRLELKDGAREISRYVDTDESPILPAWTVYENSLGGRVAVHAFDLSEKPTVSFMNWNRKYQLTSILRWLGRGRVDLQVNGGAWMVPIRRDYEDYVLIGVLNYETDDWEYLEVIMVWGCENSPKRIQIACDSLGWRDIEPAEMMIADGHLRLRLDQELAALDFLALAVSKD